MGLTDTTARKVTALIILLLFGVLIFFIIQPFVYAILWGLILAYMFFPLHVRLTSWVRSKTFSATLLVIVVLVLVVVPLWFVVPLMIQQLFEIFKFSQDLDLTHLIVRLLPDASTQVVGQLSDSVRTVITKLTSSMLSSLSSLFLNLPLILMNVFIFFFVFFFTLRDADKLRSFAHGISPFSSGREKMLINRFKEITHSILYGMVVVGLVQGLLAGLGFWVFGVKNALFLTVLAIFFSMLRVVGPYLVWIPVAFYLFSSSSLGITLGFILYNVIIVSNIDNILFTYLISKRANLSPVIALISSLGGVYFFGIIGLILGPLLFSFFLLLLELYKEHKLLEFFGN